MHMSPEDMRMQTKGPGSRHRDRMGLILTDSVIAGHQIAHLLACVCGSKMQVLRRDKPAYSMISDGHMDVVVADIDNTVLGGLALLAYTRLHWPDVTTYGLTRSADAYAMQLAQDMGGCQGFFYLSRERPSLDMQRGLAARFDAQLARERNARPHSAPQPNGASPTGDGAPALFALLNRNRLSEDALD